MDDWIVSSFTLPAKRRARREAGEYIERLRENHRPRMSQRELAEKLGYPFYSLISQVEGGLRSVPRNRMSDWAAALGVDAHDFEKNLLRPEVLQ